MSKEPSLSVTTDPLCGDANVLADPVIFKLLPSPENDPEKEPLKDPDTVIPDRVELFSCVDPDTIPDGLLTRVLKSAVVTEPDTM